MRLAFSTNAYLNFPFDEAAARIAALGYEGLELMADVPHAWPAYMLEGPKQGIRDAMAKHGLTFSNVNAFMMHAVDDHRQHFWHPSFLEPDVNYRRVRIDHTRRALSLCAELGAPHITTEPGGPIDAGADAGEQAVDLFVEVLKPLAEHADKVGVLLLIEPEPGLPRSRRRIEYLEVADRVNAPSIGLNFDVGHALLHERRPPGARSPSSRSQTRHYHFEDIASESGPPPPDPGPGRDRLRRGRDARSRPSGYDGWITVELYPNQSTTPTARRRRAYGLAPAAGEGVPDVASRIKPLSPARPPAQPVHRRGRPPGRLAPGWRGPLAARGWDGLPLGRVGRGRRYAAGMILNDVFDYRVDLAERPRRPSAVGCGSHGRLAAWLGGILPDGSARALAAIERDDRAWSSPSSSDGLRCLGMTSG